MTLGAAGLTAGQEQVYRHLVGTGPVTVDDLARTTGTDRDRVAAALDGLRDHGLVTTQGGDPPRYTAAPPDMAFSPLLLRGQEALAQAQQAVAQLAQEHRSNALRHDATQLVEVVTGTAGIRQAVRNIQLSAHDEMLWFCRAGHVAMPSSDNDEEFAAMERGVRYRVIYEQALLEEPGMLDSLVLGVRAGEEARATARLPVRLAVADRTLALCPLVSGQDGSTQPTAALVRDSNLLTALIALFESYWTAATPLQVVGGGAHRLDAASPGSPVSGEERELLSLLVAGVTDKAIATRLGISTRTVQRRVSDLMAMVNAQTRMQLAWQVAQRGWLSDPSRRRPG